MSRTGIEAKPAWRSLPVALRRHVEQTFGASVTRAARVWGGYTPTPTFRLTLADGKRAFFKGTNQTSNDISHAALVREERVYRDLAALSACQSQAGYRPLHADSKERRFASMRQRTAPESRAGYRISEERAPAAGRSPRRWACCCARR
jgi:hypothetical protein